MLDVCILCVFITLYVWCDNIIKVESMLRIHDPQTCLFISVNQAYYL